MDVITGHAQTSPDRLAVIDDRPGSEPRQMTFGELDLYTNQLANGITAENLAAGAKVMWLGQNSLEVLAFSHAARKAGMVSVPLNYRLSDEESVYVITNSDSELIFADAAYVGLLERIADLIPQVKKVVIFGGSPGVGHVTHDDFCGSDDSLVDPEEGIAGTMTYTSGTTGNPKGAVRTSRDPKLTVGLMELLGYAPGDVYVTCGPLYHSGPGGFAGMAHAIGNTIVLQHKFGAEDWLRLIDKYKCSSTFSAPTPIRMVLKLDDEIKAKYDTSSMKIMVANAAPWPFALKQAYVEDFPPESLWEIYGSTEMGVNTVLAPADQMRKPGSCGKPAPYVEVSLFDDDGNEVTEPMLPGELYVRSGSVFDTYYKAQDKYDQDSLAGDWHTVGDIAYRDEEGFLYICDRKKDMIISGGMNIYPAEIEGALEHHPGIYEVAVIGMPSEEWGESVMAVVVPTDHSLTEADVEAYAREHLAGYKMPRRIEFLDHIPKTGSNKILKRELREKYAGAT